MDYQIYIITFQGKIVYVGMTSLSLQRRLTAHEGRVFSGRRCIPKLYEHMEANSCRGYEISNVAWCEDKKIALKAERYFIEKYDTINNGLNSPPPRGNGREKGCSNPSGAEHYLYGKKLSEHVRQSVIKAQTGRKHSAETIEKRRQSNIKTKRKDRKPVVGSDGSYYEGVCVAARSIGVAHVNLIKQIKICRPCRGVLYKYKEVTECLPA